MKRAFSLPLAAVLALTLAPSVANAFDLLDAVRASRDHNAGFAAARADFAASGEQFDQGLAQILPRVELEGRFDRDRDSALHGRDIRNQTLDIELRQPLFDMARFAGFQRGRELTALGVSTFASSEQQLMLESARAFFDILVARDKDAAAKASRDALQVQLANVTEEVGLGLSAKLDQDEAQAAFDEAQANVLVAENEWELSKRVFARLTGLNPDGITARFGERFAQAGALASLDAYVKTADTDSNDLRQKSVELDIALTHIEEAAGRFLPVVELFARHRTTDSTPIYAETARTRRDNVIGVSVTIPLFAGGMHASQVREARYQADGAQARLDDTRIKVRESVIKAFLGVNSGVQQVRARLAQRWSTQNKVGTTRLGRDVGLRTNLDLLRAEKEHFEARTGLAEAFHGYYMSRLLLAYATGHLDDSVLGDLNATLVPQEG
ncbi:Outer membrane protein TolC [Pandoraea iniqua]|uniref:Outer membrane protein TolC n=1 Tax=Pandoraea iniqua TaxID=2508288 RepID=A0A5E4RV09_9BURK|nr:TolC family outer membrane protein [Pandoraea iniqua]VVD65728.1 Outer membrane protein TolC [Pandoraea iniqua]